MSNRQFLIIANYLAFTFGLFVLYAKKESNEQVVPIQDLFPPIEVVPEQEPVLPDINCEISDPVPSYKSYSDTWERIREWEDQCPDLVEVGTYGQSTRGTDLNWVKIENERLDNIRPVVLIIGATHGNESLSSSTIMSYIGTMLNEYGDNEEITNLINNRIIYFIPVVSPDSYPRVRYVDGVDPNRNYPTPLDPNKQSVKPIAALQRLFLKIRPSAVISGHTYGHVYLIPHGDTMNLSRNHNDYMRIIREMANLSHYRYQRACQIYSRPIHGTDVDWFYRNGAFSIVMEFGTHQRIPTDMDIKIEFEKTFDAVLYFIEEAPKVEIIDQVQDWRNDWNEPQRMWKKAS